MPGMMPKWQISRGKRERALSGSDPKLAAEKAAEMPFQLMDGEWLASSFPDHVLGMAIRGALLSGPAAD
jgi:hypothetical protein